MHSAVIIEKELIPVLEFTNEDVLSSNLERVKRRYELKKAERLGNVYKGKVGIIYKLLNGDFQRVETTIWSVSENFVSLKGGSVIPIKAIMQIDWLVV